jgi:hypothetical protein
MVFNPRSLFPARRSLTLPGVGRTLIDSNTLREAALRASWRRDQRVARRRLAIRWTLWWLWQYKHLVLAACVVLAGLIYLLHRNGLLPTWRASPAAVAAPDSSLTLRLERQLQERRTGSPNPPLLPRDASAPIQLKPDIQLKIKESSP